jgi:hypothetical protein
MSQDVTEKIKWLIRLAIIFAGSAFVMFIVILILILWKL